MWPTFLWNPQNFLENLLIVKDWWVRLYFGANQFSLSIIMGLIIYLIYLCAYYVQILVCLFSVQTFIKKPCVRNDRSYWLKWKYSDFQEILNPQIQLYAVWPTPHDLFMIFLLIRLSETWTSIHGGSAFHEVVYTYQEFSPESVFQVVGSGGPQCCTDVTNFWPFTRVNTNS